MKIILCILMFLFLSSNTKADDTGCGLCGEFDGLITYAYSSTNYDSGSQYNDSKFCRNGRVTTNIQTYTKKFRKLIVEISCQDDDNFFLSKGAESIEFLIHHHTNRLQFLNEIVGYLKDTKVNIKDARIDDEYYSGKFENVNGKLDFEFTEKERSEVEGFTKISFFAP